MRDLATQGFLTPDGDPAADLRGDLTGAFGLPVWGARMSSLGVGSIFMLELGQPDIANPRHGQWHLWVNMAAWRIETPKAVLVASGSDHDEMEREVVALDGKILVGSDAESPSLSAALLFADGTRLRLFTVSRDREQWLLFRPDGMIRIADANYSWKLEQGSAVMSIGRRP